MERAWVAPVPGELRVSAAAVGNGASDARWTRVSCSGSALRWPDPADVVAAVERWAIDVRESHPEVRQVGSFGSYARGDASVGSDVDLVVVVESSDEPVERRTLAFDATRLPVPADVLVFTEDQWHRLLPAPGIVRTIASEVVWVE